MSKCITPLLIKSQLWLQVIVWAQMWIQGCCNIQDGAPCDDSQLLSQSAPSWMLQQPQICLLGRISSLKLVFFLGMLLFISWNISSKFSEVIVIECYNYIILLTAVLQAEFHKVLSFLRFHIHSSFLILFLDMLLLQLVLKSFCLNC